MSVIDNCNTMSEQELPPWLKEQLARLQQLQQNLQAIMMQKQQVEIEKVETERALDELKKTTSEDIVYKLAGPLLVKSNREVLIKDLDEKKELTNTRLVVLGKQESRVKENLKEVENKINQMMQLAQSGSSQSPNTNNNVFNPHSSSK
jgi:prefoldin beta subunit